jgi:hypothetical protein
MRYEIKRTNGSTERLIATVSPTGKQSKKAMGENVVDFSFTLPRYIDFKLMDFVLVYGERYQLNVLPSVKKTAKNSFEYNMQLEAVFYDLAKVQLQFLNTKNQLLEPSFTLMGNAATIVGLIVENANRHSAGWSVGTVDDTGYKNFTFNAENCLQGLNRLAQEFETEFWIENKTIHLQKREQSSGMSFGYGQGKGLYSIFRGNNKSINIVTRLYVRGSAQNLPAGYRNASGSLLLPGGKTYYEDPAKIALYGLIEATQVFDVKPEREGVVSAVVPGTGNWKFFTDSTLDFDLNTVKLDGASKVRFNTGQLAGYSFEISAYNHQTKQVTIKKNEEEKAIDMPSDLLRPAVGDKYVLVDIAMPESYILAAENRLNQAALAYYEKNSDPVLNFAYTIDCDPIWFKKLGVQVTLGNTVIITDTDMGINGEIRIAAYKRDLQSAFKYEFEVTDSIGANEIIRQYAQQQRTLQLIESSGLLDINQIRKNIFLNRLSEQDGYLMLSGDKIKAGYSDDTDKWDGRQFDDYLNQSVRKTDSVTFLSVVADTVNSKTYVSGFTGTGYKINPDGSAEFDSLTIRKELNVNVLNVREITGSGGSIAVTNVAKIKEVYDHGTYWQCTINTDENTIAVQFRTNDIIRCQVWDGKRLKYYTARVAEVGTGAFNLTKSSKTGSGIPAAGDSVFQFGNTTDINRQGLIYLTNSDTGAPYLDVLDGINSDSLTGKTKVRLGKLSGINDPELGQLDGYGIYADRAFIKGKIVVTGGNAETLDGSSAKADAAKNAAISAASTDAQTKANFAQSAAISAAAADAIIKASAAQVAAIQSAANDASLKINNLQIGGRNLYKGFWLNTKQNYANNNYYVERYLNILLEPNTEYAFSFSCEILVGNPSDLRTAFGYGNLNSYNLDIVSWLNIPISKTQFTFKTPGVLPYPYFQWRPWLDIANAGASKNVNFWDIKFEKGNKVTGWTPAPEDVTTYAETKANEAQAAATNAGYAQAAYEREIAKAYADGIVTAEEQARITQAATNLKNARDDAQQKVNTALGAANGYTDTKSQQTLTAAQTYANNTAITKANAAQANAISQASTDAQNKANAVQAAAALLSQQLVDSVKIGGRNLLINGSFDNSPSFTEVYNANYSLLSSYGDVLPLVGNYFLFSSPQKVAPGVFYFSTMPVNVKANTQYTFSFNHQLPYITDQLNVQIVTNDGNVDVYSSRQAPTNVNRKWGQRTVIKFITGVVDKTVRFRFDAYTTAWFLMDALKLEEGTKDTDFTPSPEDVQAAIDIAKAAADIANSRYVALMNNLKSMAYQDVVEMAKLGSTIIENGMIKTTLLDANYIKTSVINAGYINTLDIVAKGLLLANRAEINNLIVRNLFTKDAGRRMEVVGADNSQIFYDENNRALTVLKDNISTFVDDDSAKTGRSLSGMQFNKYYSSNPSNPDQVSITGNGIYANTGAASASLGFPTLRTAYGSVVGYVRRFLTKGATDIQAAIVGLSSVESAHGGFFKNMAGGAALYVEGTIKVADQNGESTGRTQVYYITDGGTGQVIELKFKNGILVV